MEAGRRNRRSRGPLTETGRQRLQAAIKATKPWTRSTGPRTAAGKQRSAANGRLRQKNQISQRQILEEIQMAGMMITGLRLLQDMMAEARNERSRVLNDLV